MNKVDKKLLLFLVLLIVIIVWFCHKWRKKEPIPTKENIISLKLSKIDKPLYLKAKTWGIAGNHEEIVLSQLDSGFSNKTNDYIFYTSEVFYKIENDSIAIIYAPESLISEPVNKMSNVKIKCLKTADEIKDYNTNYQKYGLQRISVYE